MAESSEPVAGGGIGDGEAEEAKTDCEHQEVHENRLRTNGPPHGIRHASTGTDAKRRIKVRET